MELVYDWKGFDSLFHPKRRAQVADAEFPIFVILPSSTDSAEKTDLLLRARIGIHSQRKAQAPSLDRKVSIGETPFPYSGNLPDD
ncbi:MAG: hypothetical protein HYX41_00685 [Bdellovibrio sp.]|nr:hypothetical protein [Bdellovibrio sp.]